MIRLNKDAIISELQNKGLSPKDAELAYTTMLSTVIGNLQEGNTVALLGLGTIVPVVKKPEVVTKFGKSMQVGHRIVLQLKTSRTFIKNYKLKYDVDAQIRNRLKALIKPKK